MAKASSFRKVNKIVTENFNNSNLTIFLTIVDAQVIISILKELGVEDFENRVINQLLEFTYRYVTCILDDAK